MEFNKNLVKLIVVFAPNKLFFGANILQVPFFQHIRMNFLNAEIIIWSPESASGMMLKLNLANKLYLYNNYKDYFKIMLFLWKKRPDIVFNLRSTSEGLNILTGLSFARLRIGFKTISPFTLLFNGSVNLNEYTYMANLYLALLKPVKPSIYFYFEGIKELERDSLLIVPNNRINICFMPAGGEGEHKKWGIGNFCELGKLIYAAFPSAFIYIIIGPQEKDYIKVIEGEFPINACYILESGSMADIVKITRNSVLTVANDCGPSHLAQMSDVNYIGIWGWMKQQPQSRIIKWTMARPNSVHIIAREGDDIKKIKPHEVMRVVHGFISSTN